MKKFYRGITFVLFFLVLSGIGNDLYAQCDGVPLGSTPLVSIRQINGIFNSNVAPGNLTSVVCVEQAIDPLDLEVVIEDPLGVGTPVEEYIIDWGDGNFTNVNVPGGIPTFSPIRVGHPAGGYASETTNIGTPVAPYPISVSVRYVGQVSFCTSTGDITITRRPIFAANINSGAQCAPNSWELQVDPRNVSVNAEYDIDWGDGSPIEVIVEDGSSSYLINHFYPSDPTICEYTVTVTARNVLDGACDGNTTITDVVRKFDIDDPQIGIYDPITGNPQSEICETPTDLRIVRETVELPDPNNPAALCTPGTRTIRWQIFDGATDADPVLLSTNAAAVGNAAFLITDNIGIGAIPDNSDYTATFPERTAGHRFLVRSTEVNPCGTEIEEQLITVVASPVASINVSPDTVTCVNETLTFTRVNAGGIDYTWLVVPGLNTGIPSDAAFGAPGNENPFTFSTATAGDYTVWLRAAGPGGGLEPLTCISYDSIQIEVLPDVVPDFNLTVQGGTLNNCDFATIDLDGSATANAPANSIFTYEISRNTAFTDIEHTLTGTIDTYNNFVVDHPNNSTRFIWYVRLTVTTPQGCSDVTPTQTFRTRLLPEIDAIFNNNPQFCSGGTTNMVVDLSSGNSNVRANMVAEVITGAPTDVTGYSDVNGLRNGNSVNQTLVNTTNAPQTVRYIFTPENRRDAGGNAADFCVNTADNDTVLVVVDPEPGQPTISPATGNPALTICADGSTVVLTSDNPGGVAVTYEWFRSTNLVTPIQATTSNTLTLSTVAQSGDYVVRVRGAAPSNCPSVFSNPVTVVINPLPAAPSNPADNTYCSDQGANAVSVDAPGAGFAIDWYDSPTGGSLLLANSASYNPGGTPPTTTYYAETRNTITGCVSATRSAATLTRFDSPTDATLSRIDAGTLCAGDSIEVQLAINPNPGPLGGTYFVVLSDALGNNADAVFPAYVPGSSVFVTVLLNADYQIDSVADENGCFVDPANFAGNAAVTVSGPTAASIDIDVSGTTPICLGTSTNLDVNITGGTSPYTVYYNNNLGDGQFVRNTYINGTPFVVTPSAAGQITYTLDSVFDNVGCKIPASALTTTAIIDVFEPEVVLSYPAASDVCQGDSIALFVIETNGSDTLNLVIQDQGGIVVFSDPAYVSGDSIKILPPAGVTTTYSIQSVTDAVLPACTVTDNTPGGGPSVVVNLNPAINTQPLDVVICHNTDTAFVVETVPGVLYEWQTDSASGGAIWHVLANGAGISGVTNDTLRVLARDALNGFSFRVRVIDNVTTCDSISDPGLLTVNPLPVITTQPLNAVACDLNTTFFNVAVASAAFTFQWQTDNGTGGVTWTSLSNDATYTNVTASQLDILANVSLDGFRYRVIVTDPATLCDSISVERTLTVNPPIGTTSPVNQAACHGETIDISVVPDNPTYVFFWQTDNGTSGTTWNNLTNGGLFSNVNFDTLRVQADNSINNHQFRVRVFNPSTGCDSITDPMTLTVNPLPEITQQPVDEVICHNDEGEFVVRTASAAFTYQWQTDSGTAGVTWSDIADNSTYTGAVNDTLRVLGDDLINGFRFRVVVSNPATNCDSTSTDAGLTVNPLPVISIQPVDVATCEADTADFTVTIADVTDQIQWQADNGTAGVTWTDLTAGALFLDVTTDRLRVVVDPANDGWQFRAVVTDPGTLCDSISDPAGLTLQPLPGIVTQPTDVVVCHNDSDQFDVVTDGGSYTFRWQTDNGTGGVTWSNLNNGGFFSGAFSTTLSFTASNTLNGHRYRLELTNPVTNCVSLSNEVGMTVNPLPVITTQPQNAETCVSGIGLIGVTTADPTDLFQWQINTGSGFSTISDGTVFFGTTTDTVAILDPSGLNGAQFRVIVFDAVTNCDSISNAATLTVTPEPTVPAAMAPIDICGLLSTALSGTVPANGTGAWSVATQPAAASSVVFVDGVNDPNTRVQVDAFGTYEFEWTISNGSCTPVSAIVEVTYFDDPSPSQADAGGADTLSFCGTAINLNAAAPTIGTGRWFQVPGGTGPGTITFDPSTTDRNAIARINPGEQGTYLLVWEVSNGPCSASIDTVVASFDAEPPLTPIMGADTICQGASNELYLVTQNVGSTWDWTIPAGITVNNGAGISNGGLPSDNFALLEFPTTGTFTIQVFETLATCTVTETKTIVVEGPVTTNSIVGQDTVCAGTTAVPYSVPNNVGSIYNWTINTTEHIIQPPNNVNSIEVDFGSLPGTFQLLVTETTTGGCISTQPDTLDIVVLDIPDVSTSIPNPVICSGDSLGVTVNSPKGIASTTIELLSVSQTGGITGFSLPGDTFNPGDTLPDVLLNSASSNRQIEYVFTAYTTGSGFSACNGDTVTMLVTVRPTPGLTINNTRPVLCSETNTSIVLDSDVPTADFTWTATASDPAITGFADDASGAFEVITQELVNSSNAVHTVQYIVTATAATCVSAPDTTIVTINPQPAVGLVALDTLICEGESARLSIEFTGGLAPFDFTFSNGLINTPVNNAADSLGVTVSPAAGTVSYNILTVTDARGCQISQPNSAISNDGLIEVLPIPQAVITGGGVICEGDSASILVSISGGSAPYQVELDNGVGTIGGFSSGDIIQVAPPISTTYQLVRIEDSQGCGVTAPNTNLLGISTVLVNTPPTAEIISEDVAFCDDNGLTTTELTFSMTGTGPWTLDYANETDTTRINFIASSVFSVDVPGALDDTVTYQLVNVFDGNIPSCSGAVTGSMDVLRQSLPTGSLTGSTTICQGDATDITFELTGVGPFDVIYTDGVSNFTLENISNGHLQSVSPQVNTNYRIISVTDARTVACNANNFGNSATIAVIAEPVADILQSSTGGCAPFLATFQNLANPTGAQRWYYRRQGVDERISELTGNSASFVFDNATSADLTYQVVLEVETGSGCISTDTTTVTVAPTIVPAFATSANISDCTPLTVDFVNQSVAGTATTVSLWDWGDGNLPDTTAIDGSISHTFENSSFIAVRNFNVTLTVIDTVTGCEARTSSAVEVFPEVRAEIEEDINSGCAPLLVGFTNLSQGATDHLWFYREEGTTTVLESTNTFFASFEFQNQTEQTRRFEVFYIGGNGSGCTDTAMTVIEVFPELLATFDVNPQRMILPENTVTITNNTALADAWTYNWDFGDGTSSTAVNPGQKSYASFGTYRITMVVSNGDCEETVVRQIEILPVEPEIDFDFSITEGCAPLTVNFTNLSRFADPDTYLWNFGDGGISTQVNPTHTYSEPGTFTVSLSASNDLGIVVTRFADVNIQVNRNATASFNVRPGLVFLNGDANGNQVSDEVAYANFSINAASFIWDFGDSTTSEDFEPVHRYSEEGVYDVSLIAINENGCNDTARVELAVTVQAGGDVGIPNVFTPSEAGPSGGFVSGGGSGAGNEGNDIFLPRYVGVTGFKMEIYSRWGELVFISEDQNIGWDGYVEGQLAPQGVYLYKLTLEFVDGQRTTRLGDVTILR